ncbi:unnamed protein product [Ectocarpus sp. 12 AP-2014]
MVPTSASAERSTKMTASLKALLLVAWRWPVTALRLRSCGGSMTASRPPWIAWLPGRRIVCLSGQTRMHIENIFLCGSDNVTWNSSRAPDGSARWSGEGQR